MKALLDNYKKYLVPIEIIDQIVEVECIGDEYDADAKYSIVGEADISKLVKESSIVQGEDAETARQENASEELEKLKKSHNALVLKNDRDDAFHRIDASHNGEVTSTEIRNYVNSVTYSHTLKNATHHDVAKWAQLKNLN